MTGFAWGGHGNHLVLWHLLLPDPYDEMTRQEEGGKLKAALKLLTVCLALLPEH